MSDDKFSRLYMQADERVVKEAKLTITMPNQNPLEYSAPFVAATIQNSNVMGIYLATPVDRVEIISNLIKSVIESGSIVALSDLNSLLYETHGPLWDEIVKLIHEELVNSTMGGRKDG